MNKDNSLKESEPSSKPKSIDDPKQALVMVMDIRGFSQWALGSLSTTKEIARVQRKLELKLFLGFNGLLKPSWYKPLGDGFLVLWLEPDDRMRDSAVWLIPYLNLFKINKLPDCFSQECPAGEDSPIRPLEIPRKIGVTFSYGEVARYRRIRMDRNSKSKTDDDYDYAGRPIILATKYQKIAVDKVIADKAAYDLLKPKDKWESISYPCNFLWPCQELFGIDLPLEDNSGNANQNH